MSRGWGSSMAEGQGRQKWLHYAVAAQNPAAGADCFFTHIWIDWEKARPTLEEPRVFHWPMPKQATDST